MIRIKIFLSLKQKIMINLGTIALKLNKIYYYNTLVLTLIFYFFFNYNRIKYHKLFQDLSK